MIQINKHLVTDLNMKVLGQAVLILHNILSHHLNTSSHFWQTQNNIMSYFMWRSNNKHRI